MHLKSIERLLSMPLMPLTHSSHALLSGPVVFRRQSTDVDRSRRVIWLPVRLIGRAFASSVNQLNWGFSHRLEKWPNGLITLVVCLIVTQVSHFSCRIRYPRSCSNAPTYLSVVLSSYVWWGRPHRPASTSCTHVPPPPNSRVPLSSASLCLIPCINCGPGRRVHLHTSLSLPSMRSLGMITITSGGPM
ncbi:hypothetical protein DB88DRAFT_476908 [Papiliotrema laurentii]|uniref:Uncharacterized protein n=1 Tax=Papiliotrema laurentii TaxID=5418 RepID=A0AAD9FVR1_PAPLA|nr:hypothetical protein DB88DRAFT_476908 [Papiliotrema laurentii]